MGLYTITDLASGHVEIGRFRGGGHHRGGRGGGRRWGRGGYGDGYYPDYYDPFSSYDLIYEDELPDDIQIVR